MERMNDEGQWIVLMGFIISVSIFFLAFIVSQSTVVGQTTSEAVLEFPKTEIQDFRSQISDLSGVWLLPAHNGWNKQNGAGHSILTDIRVLSMYRQNAVVDFDIQRNATVNQGGILYHPVTLHFNNGVTDYHEMFLYPRRP
jgi:hypothetical protein